MSASTMAGVEPTVDVILKPICGQAKLTRNCSKTPLGATEGPRFLLEAHLEEIPVVMSEQQYGVMVRMVEVIGRRWRARRYRRWRPSGGAREK